MSQTVVLMRHARTSWNAQGRFNSTVDIGIDEVGRHQAEVAATALARLDPFAFVRSDASRARETAHPLGQQVGRSPEVEPRLAELDFGPFEGRHPDELAQDPAYLAWDGGGDPAPDGPEGLDAAAARVSAGFTDVLGRHHSARTVVVVSHGVLLRILVCSVALGLPPTAYRRLVLDNTRAAVLRVGEGDPGVRLLAMNVTAADLVDLLQA